MSRKAAAEAALSRPACCQHVQQPFGGPSIRSIVVAAKCWKADKDLTTGSVPWCESCLGIHCKRVRSLGLPPLLPTLISRPWQSRDRDRRVTAHFRVGTVIVAVMLEVSAVEGESKAAAAAATGKRRIGDDQGAQGRDDSLEERGSAEGSYVNQICRSGGEVILESATDDEGRNIV